MFKKNLLVLVRDGIQVYANQLGKRHLDVLKEACYNNNIVTDKTNELELALYLASNNFLTFMNTDGATVLCVPEELSEYQINFLETKKGEIYSLQDNGIVEVVIPSKTPIEYNTGEYYRNLGIEEKIAKYEGTIYNSQLDILYEYIDNQKGMKNSK